MKQVLITVCREEIALRFDMTSEVLLVSLPDDENGTPGQWEQKQLVLARNSSEELCELIFRLGARLLVCGAIEEDYYHYLRWKRVDIISDVAGSVQSALARLAVGVLRNGDAAV